MIFYELDEDGKLNGLMCVVDVEVFLVDFLELEDFKLYGCFELFFDKVDDVWFYFVIDGVCYKCEMNMML